MGAEVWQSVSVSVHTARLSARDEQVAERTRAHDCHAVDWLEKMSLVNTTVSRFRLSKRAAVATLDENYVVMDSPAAGKVP